MSSGNNDVPAPPDYAREYQRGLDVFLKNYENLLNKEGEARATYDPERIAHQQLLQELFGPIQTEQQLDTLRQFDPQSFAVRDELSKRVLSDLESGYELPDEYAREIEQSVRGAQTARGNIFGEGPASAEGAVKGRAALERYQMALGNAGNFLSSPTPTQQSLGLSPVSADRGMSYVTPNAGTSGVNFGLQNYSNLLARQQLVNNQGGGWTDAALGAAQGYATGGWGGLVAGGISGYYSSRKVKRDIVRVGTSPQGIAIYEFRYKPRGLSVYRGVIAEEIAESHPHAVGVKDGTFFVDYGQLDVAFEKRCVKCNTFKPVSTSFYRRKGGKDGHRSECKICQDVKRDAWIAANPERAKDTRSAFLKVWRIKNRDRFLAKARIRDRARWPKRSKQQYEAKKRWMAANPELHRERERRKQRQWRAKYPERARAHGRRTDRKRQAAKTTYMRERRRSNINFRLACSLRGKLSATLSGKIKSCSALALLGCSVQDFRIYLESKFEPGMSWANYGKYGWHVDHIMPLAIFDLSKPEHQKRAFHFSNMQPLWATDNLTKNAKPPSVHQFSFL